MSLFFAGPRGLVNESVISFSSYFFSRDKLWSLIISFSLPSLSSVHEGSMDSWNFRCFFLHTNVHIRLLKEWLLQSHLAKRSSWRIGRMIPKYWLISYSVVLQLIFRKAEFTMFLMARFVFFTALKFCVMLAILTIVWYLITPTNRPIAFWGATSF